MERLQTMKNRDSTLNNYLAVWRIFNRFLIKLGARPKAWEDCVNLFATHMIQKGKQSATVKSYISAIKCIVTTYTNYKWNDGLVLLSSLTRACRLINDKVYTRMPIQLRLLDLLSFQIARSYRQQPYLKTLYQTMLMYSYYGLMRIGEITQSEHMVKAKNVHIGINKNKILIILYSSKTHGFESRPQKIKITGQDLQKGKAKCRQFSCFCPFKITKAYLKLRGDYTMVTEQFFVYRDNSPVKPEHFRTMLKQALKKVGVEASKFNSHSLRIGRCTDLINFGYTIEQVKRARRWKSNTVYKYIKQ